MKNVDFYSKKRKSKVKAFFKIGKDVDYVVFLKKTNLNMYAFMYDMFNNLILSSSTKDLKINAKDKTRTDEASDFGSQFAKMVLKNYPSIKNKFNSKDKDLNDNTCIVHRGENLYIGRVKSFIDSFNSILL